MIAIRRHHVALAIFTISASACTKSADQCNTNADCKDPMYPFCDVSGQYPTSDGIKHICTIDPPGCPVDVCGCNPGAATCVSGQLAVCDASGMSITTSSCSLGCDSGGSACASFVPSNGLGAALAASAGQAAVNIVTGATIDTDTGVIIDDQGNQITVASLLVAQPASSIRAFYAASFLIGSVNVVGSNALALVALGKVTVTGILDAGGHFSTGGPGAVSSGACVGSSTTSSVGSGPGGGGNATQGGPGGGYQAPGLAGGQPETGFSPLLGGCAGGGSVTSSALGGGGGGAIDLVSATDVSLLGIIDLAGGGGPQDGGGGAGGTLLVESPTIELGPAGGIAANGGGGGGGGLSCNVNPDYYNGSDGLLDSQPASGGFGGCPIADGEDTGGDGATGSQLPVGGAIDTGSGSDTITYGGGGGAVGRVHFVSADGTYTASSSSIKSAAITNDTLVIQ